ncbi:class I SAM-dependent methyltransferase [Phreatobacter stygius]|uniref:Class I SAM-dependent methyltransferase n=1 Tax=Phreatobacter stygius TaxID=1940610 RepID=A0A4D7BBD2_9HYPH|nr:class I SAM-dependent methyltransferase [Phreatobacter stygius]QCI65387.1 class I SAM-dependent methyltransferase [Phreatobacter stygius]
MTDWRSFWDGEHAIYVNATHKAVHYKAIADGILRHLAETGAGPDAVVLDYACGEALEAGRIAQACGRLVLCDGAPSVVARLRDHFGGLPDVIASVLPEELDSVLADHAADLIMVSSLIQYLTRADLGALLDRFRAKLKPSGRLVIADVISPDTGIVADVGSLLRNAAAHGFLFAAIAGLAATAISPYRKIRSELGLSTYSQADMLGLFAEHGFAAERYQVNLGLTPHRMTFVARPS